MPTPPRLITHAGETLPIEQWASRRGLAVETLRCRLDRLGWEVGRALDTPADRRFRKGGRKPAGPRPCPPMTRHRPTGQARARWVAGGKEHTAYFGPWGSAEAAAAYQRFAAEWAAAGGPGVAGTSVAALVVRWLTWCEANYVKAGRPTSEAYLCRLATRDLVGLYGTEPADRFGPLKLRAVREAMVARGWSRKSINLHCSRVVRCFRWATGQGLLPAGIWHALAAVEWLKPGRTAAPDRARRAPADPAAVRATLRHLHPKPAARRVLATMVRLQQLTGMRPGEVCGLRPCDLAEVGDLLVYTVPPHLNKNEHRERPQRYFFGPRAQGLLRPLLQDADPAGPVFRLKPGGSGVGRNRYSLLIRQACGRAGVRPWTPHQLRHALATAVAAKYGSIGKAAAAIGDTARTAAAVYVHVDPDDVARMDLARDQG